LYRHDSSGDVVNTPQAPQTLPGAGGSFTVFVDGNLFRIAIDADAIGRSRAAPKPAGACDR
jgi:hypothetical protein